MIGYIQFYLYFPSVYSFIQDVFWSFWEQKGGEDIKEGERTWMIAESDYEWSIALLIPIV